MQELAKEIEDIEQKLVNIANSSSSSNSASAAKRSRTWWNDLIQQYLFEDQHFYSILEASIEQGEAAYRR